MRAKANGLGTELRHFVCCSTPLCFQGPRSGIPHARVCWIQHRAFTDLPDWKRPHLPCGRFSYSEPAHEPTSDAAKDRSIAGWLAQ